MMNRVILVGRITKDPEVKQTQSNIPVASFTLAVNRQFADQSGERQADFIQCVVWRKQAENLARFVKKGALLGIEGRIQTRTYEAENGTRYVTEVLCDSIQFLESKGDSEPYEKEEQTSSLQEEFYETSKELAAEEDLPF
ncbi:MAG: single-stranded DNA-binding protein [Tenericutes bacterium HGW-Tenericutes-6]|jgi:single-strand DNA-binding protein|nr:MAG: single-stranded DNA-binding protein [Tenericutes bacterium HGW-Tenericutes-6]